MTARVGRQDERIAQLCEQLFGARISAGTVDPILARLADALEQFAKVPG